MPGGQEPWHEAAADIAGRTGHKASHLSIVPADGLLNRRLRHMGDDVYWGPDFAALRQTDPEIADVVLDELNRLRGGLQLIASENLTSPAVLAALGSTLTNKYAEGYPGKRYYGGCAEVDRAEELAIERARALFGVEHANVQPHSGASANLAAYAALLQPGDTVLAMELPHGGHLTHGSKVNFSGRWFNTVGYPVREDDELIDYDEVSDLARQHRPRLIICGATAYPRLIDFARFRAVADEVGAYLMVDAAHFIGLVAGKAIPSPVPYADVVCATTHKVLRGPRGGLILCRDELAGRIDKAVFPFTQGGPLMHVVAAKAVALREAAAPSFAEYAKQVVANAKALAAGLSAEGMRPVSGGTDTHLALIDLRSTGISGRDAEARCDAARITLNKNAIPYDPQKPMIASGLRVGTPSVTTQGMQEPQMREIAELIALAVRSDPEAAAGKARLAEVAERVTALVARFPAYPEQAVASRT
jgi:glycine hydroxymethyltransferase